MFEVKIETHFSSAHHLLHYKGVCENQHGHNWRVEVFVAGETLDKSNILVDFKVLKREVNKIVDYLDHADINELPEFAGVSPSSEILAKFIYERVKEKFLDTPFGVSKVSVYETPTSCATYWESVSRCGYDGAVEAAECSTTMATWDEVPQEQE